MVQRFTDATVWPTRRAHTAVDTYHSFPPDNIADAILSRQSAGQGGRIPTHPSIHKIPRLLSFIAWQRQNTILIENKNKKTAEQKCVCVHINLRAAARAGAGAAVKPRMRKDGLNVGEALLWVGREHGLAGKDARDNERAFVQEWGRAYTNGGMRT